MADKVIVTYRNPLENLVTSSIGKFWLIAAIISTSPDPKKPQTMIFRLPSVSER